MEKLEVKKDDCIGCGMCISMFETYFDFDDMGLSEAKDEAIKDDDKKALLDVIESCPTNAIIINTIKDE